MKFLKVHKNKIFKGMVLLFLIVMLVFSDAAFRGASSGLLLWFHNVLPTLLPFIIVSNLIIRLNISKQISRFFHPFLGKLFHVSSEGCYPIVIGFLSGLPMGAKTSADLVIDNRISRQEGQFLFTMCNNASPMFIIGFIALTQLKLPDIKFALFVIIYGSAILSALIFRYFFSPFIRLERVHIQEAAIDRSSTYTRFSFDLVDRSIMNGFEIVTRIGGYIILFSIFAQIMKEALPGSGIVKAALMGIFEITTGISQICGTESDMKTKIVLITALTSFGGFSGMAQTKSVLQDSRLSINVYLFVKFISATIALLMGLLFVTFIY